MIDYSNTPNERQSAMATRYVYCVTTLPIPAPAHRWRRRMLIALAVLVLALVALYLIGAHAQAQALTECMPGITPEHTGSMTFNACARLDASQVIDRR